LSERSVGDDASRTGRISKARPGAWGQQRRAREL
jgi:hypothetical protein